jgi:galactan endo-1,6-beta-galactosidase
VSLRAALLLLACSIPLATARADYTVKPNTADNRGVWEGWGTSLCWWGNLVGASQYESKYAQLLFSYDSVDFLGNGTLLPGLGLNIARYNIGGGGASGDYPGVTENVASTLSWWRDINGYWVNPTTWNWTRDPWQRSMMTAARDIRVSKGLSPLQVEFFSNAPMWWMMSNNSSDGGTLLSSQEKNFAHYVATVAAYAKANWGITPVSVEPFNEPAAGWWTYPHNQEGCNIGVSQQTRIVSYLDSELSAAGIAGTVLAASDENSMSAATSTWNTFKSTTINSQVVANLVDRVNTHSYNSGSSSNRTGLRSAVGSKKVWATEYGNNDALGTGLADQIVGDLFYLKPAAWIYWQVVEPAAWGLVTANFSSTSSDSTRGKPVGINQKYYVMAQFTRSVPNGYTIYGTGDQYTVCSYSASEQRLTFVTVNHSTAQNITYDLTPFASVGATSATVQFTEMFSGGRGYQTRTVPITNKTITIAAGATTVYSISISPISLSGTTTADTYQAENGTLAGGAFLETTNTGYNGTGYVNFPTTGGSLTFNGVDGNGGGAKTISIRYANGSGASRTGALVVNGVSSSITFPATSSWTTWATLNVTVTLANSTTNTIALQSNGQDLANIDQVTVP